MQTPTERKVRQARVVRFCVGLILYGFGFYGLTFLPPVGFVFAIGLYSFFATITALALWVRKVNHA